jgi:hypothetical protein
MPPVFPCWEWVYQSLPRAGELYSTTGPYAREQKQPVSPVPQLPLPLLLRHF